MHRGAGQSLRPRLAAQLAFQGPTDKKVNGGPDYGHHFSAIRHQLAVQPRNSTMTSPLRSLIAAGTKIWLDSIDPDLVAKNRALGATGATSNPIIISDLIKTGRFDHELEELTAQNLSDDQIAWQMTDKLVSEAQAVFRPVWDQTHGNDGFVSFELDPLLEDPAAKIPSAQRTVRYVELGLHW